MARPEEAKNAFYRCVQRFACEEIFFFKFFVREKMSSYSRRPHLHIRIVVLHVEEEVVAVVVKDLHIMIEEEITTEIDPETDENEIDETNDVVDRGLGKRLWRRL